MKTIVIASKNRHKVREIKEMLAGMDFTVKSLEDFPDYVIPLETGRTFLENAQIKARALRKYVEGKGPVRERGATYILADDSGLECADLNGLPGVKSARFAGPNATDEDNNKKLIEMFRGVTHGTRAARYVCAMVLILPDGRESDITETCPGHIVMVPKGKNGFGYDPYFYLEAYNKTMAELEPKEKNRISHRGKALGKLVKALVKAG